MVLVLFCLENENNLLPVEFFWRTYVLVEMKKTGRCCWLALIFVNALVAMARNMQVALLSPVTEDEVPGGGEDDITDSQGEKWCAIGWRGVAVAVVSCVFVPLASVSVDDRVWSSACTTDE
jgi:hypothetical protein